MKIGPKYKIAKRLGAPIFEKTQTQKFELSQAKVGKTRSRRPGQMSDYKKQLIEKQKMRFSYGISSSLKSIMFFEYWVTDLTAALNIF